MPPTPHLGWHHPNGKPTRERPRGRAWSSGADRGKLRRRWNSMTEPITVGGRTVSIGKIIALFVAIACLVLFLTGHLTLAVACLVGALAVAFVIGVTAW